MGFILGVGGMPKASVELAVIGVLAMELTRQDRTLLKRCLRRITSQKHRAATVKLRGPRTEAETLVALEAGQDWFGKLELIADAVFPVPTPWWVRLWRAIWRR